MDWSKLVSDLMAAGMRQHEIAREVEMSQAWVAKLHKPADPPHEVIWSAAQRLIALHAQRCGTETEPRQSA